MFLEPVNTEGFEYIRVKESDHWVLTGQMTRSQNWH